MDNQEILALLNDIERDYRLGVISDQDLIGEIRGVIVDIENSIV